MILLTDVQDPNITNIICARIIQTINQPILVENETLYVGVSLGISMYPQHGDTTVDLKKASDLALYASKEAGRNRATMYQAYMSLKAMQRRKMETDIKSALQNNEFEPWYQPIVEIETNKMVGAECLIRWFKHDAWVDPSSLIAAAEEGELIEYLTRYMIDRVCEDISEWLAAGYNPPTIAINVNAKSFVKDRLISSVVHTVNRANIPANLIELEITETTLIPNFERTNQAVMYLNSFGIKTVIDDFGTGYSSLSYLNKLNISKIKIDRSFVSNIVASAESRSLVKGILSLSQSLCKRVVAEGVENEQPEKHSP